MSDRPRSLLGGTDRFVADLEAWVAGTAADEAAGERRRERSLRAQAHEEATLAGVLVDLAERDHPVLVATRARRHHRADIRVVGRDFVLLSTERSSALLVRLAAVTAVRSGADAPAVTGDRSLRLDVGLHDALAVLVEDRPRVGLVTGGGEIWRGELRQVGQDVLVVRLDGDGGRAHIPIHAVDEVVLDDTAADDALG